MKTLSRLLQGIASNHDGEYYCMNCPYSFRKESKLKSYGNVCRDHDCCHIIMSEGDNNILAYNQDTKSLKTPFIVYVNTESLL